ncbi:MAG: DEAD/DEAH box helicase, partial [Rikenellaceae bacterium]
YKPTDEVFENVDIKGGIAVTYRDSEQNFGKIGTYTKSEELNSILKKVVDCSGFSSLSSIIYPQNKFNLNALYQEHPSFKNIVGSEGREKRLTTSIFEQLDIFTDEKIDNNSFVILGLIKNIRIFRYVPKKYIETHISIDKYKVLVPKSNGTGAMGEVLSTPIVGEPETGFTQSFIGIGAFDTLSESEAAMKYIKSKFARTMLGVLKVTQDNSREVWKYVPMQNFTQTSDIDWSKPIKEIDSQLYKKYNLTPDEITFIESTIKPME